MTRVVIRVDSSLDRRIPDVWMDANYGVGLLKTKGMFSGL